jgi:hypothetical protein
MKVTESASADDLVVWEGGLVVLTGVVLKVGGDGDDTGDDGAPKMSHNGQKRHNECLRAL